MPNFNTPQQALRYHVTGAIERGEGTAIVGIPALGHEDMVLTCEDKQIFRMHGLTPDGGLDTPVKRYQAADQRDADYMRLTLAGGKRSRLFGRWQATVNERPASKALFRSYGYFENVHNGSGGGLWFEGRKLVDFDGAYELPTAVQTILADLGYVIDEFTRD